MVYLSHIRIYISLSKGAGNGLTCYRLTTFYQNYSSYSISYLSVGSTFRDTVLSIPSSAKTVMQTHHSVASAAASNCICSEGSSLGIDGPRVLRLQQGAGSSCKERRRWRTGNWQLPIKVVNDVPVGIHSIGGVFPLRWSSPGFKTPALPYALHRPPQKSESQAK
jgi:hypothetical protein